MKLKWLFPSVPFIILKLQIGNYKEVQFHIVNQQSQNLTFIRNKHYIKTVRNQDMQNVLISTGTPNRKKRIYNLYHKHGNTTITLKLCHRHSLNTILQEIWEMQYMPLFILGTTGRQTLKVVKWMQYCDEENTDWWANAGCTWTAQKGTASNSLPIVTALAKARMVKAHNGKP